MKHHVIRELKLTHFISNILSDPFIDLSVYKDKEYCKNLRKISHEHIHSILFQIHIDQLNAESKGVIFELNKIINTKHKVTGCTMLDYCLIAGLDDLAMRLASLGCTNSTDTKIFTQNLQNHYTNDRPNHVEQIIKTLNKIEITKESHQKLEPTKPKTRWDKTKEYIRNNKYSIMLLIFGTTCIALSPLTAGASTILLLSLGIPSIFAAIASHQSSTSAQQSFDQVATQSRVYFEAKEIRKLLSLSKIEVKPEMETNNTTQIKVKKNKNAQTCEYEHTKEVMVFTAKQNDADIKEVKAINRLMLS